MRILESPEKHPADAAHFGAAATDACPDKPQSGFVLIIFVIAMMIALLLGSLGASAAALSYADSVDRTEYRLQAGLDARSCAAIALLGFAHDYFYSPRNQAVPDFSCTIVSASRAGADIVVTAVGIDQGVSASFTERAQDTGRSIEIVP